jgi:hypothetical protein
MRILMVSHALSMFFASIRWSTPAPMERMLFPQLPSSKPRETANLTAPIPLRAS